MDKRIDRHSRHQRFYIIARRLRKAYKDGKLTEKQIDRLEAIGFKWEPRYNASLAETHPELAAEWHPTKNGDLTPRDVTAGCNKNVWWGHWHEETRTWHEWRASVRNRAINGQGCPFESNKRVLSGFNDLATTHPELAAEWHPVKNGDLTPRDVTAGSGKIVWWRHWHEETRTGHEWEERVSSRIGAKKPCPYCANKRLLVGSNDLATKRPDIAAEWHPTKNGDLTPRDVVAGSGRKVWWKCPTCGGEWKAPIARRTRANACCPYCTNKKALSGFNDLATTHPELAAEWHPVKNGDLTPRDVTAGSGKIVWWKCSACGGEWKTAVSMRTSQGTGCPYCVGKKALPGFNDLATTHPELAAEWHPTKNGSLTPRDVTAGSNKRVWWRCRKGHEWPAAISSRARGSGCPFESNKRVLSGFNDLATTHPELAAEWHPVKNGDLTPRDVIAGSGKIVWWRHWHEETRTWHEWEARIYSRTKHGDSTGCPVCGRGVIGWKVAKAVIRLEDGAFFPSLRSVTSDGKPVYNIERAIKYNRTAGGYHWRYATEEEVATQKAKARDGE